MFSGVDIKGGVAVTYHDVNFDHEPIGLFIPEPILQKIAEKAAAKSSEDSLYSIAGTQCNYNFDELYKDHPDYRQYISGNGKHSQLKSNALERVPIFSKERTTDSDIRIFGLADRKRVYRWCPARYIDSGNDCLFRYKVIIPASNGSGLYGEVLSTPVIGEPNTGFTQTFMCIGRFQRRDEAENALKYIKTKFCRSLLDVLKNTQHNPPITWRLIPLQGFSSTSDIDWSKSVAEIDQQLYAKYGLSDEEINFIETHVKEMD